MLEKKQGGAGGRPIERRACGSQDQSVLVRRSLVFVVIIVVETICPFLMFINIIVFIEV